MILVGEFSEKDLIEKKDVIEIRKKMRDTGCKYVNYKYSKNKLTVWLCEAEECKDLQTG